MSVTDPPSRPPLSRVPELKLLSSNECPNASVDSIFGTGCTTGALTFWGFCGSCWNFHESRIPKAWLDRVEAAQRAAAS